MRANRRRDTKPERLVRSLLHDRGLRFRVDMPIRVGSARPIKPDIVFTRAKLCCFVDGCWWHGCEQHGRRTTGSNSHYWEAKIARNMERDAEQEALLRSDGWSVIRFWEHEDPEDVATKIAAALAAARRQDR
jgi:DNA mismatch endonuclease, patch repair protein